MNKITKVGFIHTPESWDELLDWINRHHRDQRPPLVTAAGMGYNMAVKDSQSTKESTS